MPFRRPPVPIRNMPETTISPPSHCFGSAGSPSTRTDRISEEIGIMPENAAAVNALERLIPAYQKTNASAVTNTPYQARASHSRASTMARRLTGLS